MSDGQLDRERIEREAEIKARFDGIAAKVSD